MYRRFNQREADGVLEFLTEDVHWPKAFEGGYVVGKEAVKEYWTRQWREIDATVIPTRTRLLPDGRIEVTVHQVMRDMTGAVLMDATVFHDYTVEGDLFSAMDVRAK